MDLTQITNTADALTYFDELPIAELDFMLGRWRGDELTTQHPIEGLLGAIGWYGKEFISADHVHPLLCTPRQGTIFPIRPYPLLMKAAISIPLFRQPVIQPINRATLYLLRTHHSQARLRMMSYRGKTSSTMIYDGLPIHDTFRRIDDHTLLGLMDFKGVDQPYFFVLYRE